MCTHPLRPHLVLALASLLAIVLFLLGITVPQAHLWGGFLLPILVVFLWGRRRDIYIITAIASVLVVAEYWTEWPAALTDLLVNHLLPLTMLWTAAWLLSQRQQMQKQLAHSEQDLEQQVKDRTAELKANEQQLDKIFRANPGGIAITRQSDGRFLEANDAYLAMVGYTRDQLIGRTLVELDVLSAESRARVKAAFQAQGYLRGHDLQLIKANGEPVDILYSLEQIEFNGEPCYLGLVVDVTERKQLAAHANRLAAIVEASHEAIISADLAGTVVSVNRSAEELFEVSATQVVGRNIVDITLPQNTSGFHEALKCVGAGEVVTLDDVSWQMPDGTSKILSVSLSPIPDDAGAVIAFTALARDITARRHVEAALRKSEELYRTLVSHAADGIFSVDREGRYLEVNDRFCQMLGCTRDEILGAHLNDMTLDVTPEFFAAVGEELARHGSSTFERRLRHKDGIFPEVEVTVAPLSGGRRVAIVHDISTRKAAERALRASEARFATLFRSSPVGITLTRLADGRFQEVNAAFSALIGCSREEIIGSNSLELGIISPEDWARRTGVLQAQGSEQGYDLVLHTKYGEQRHTLLAVEIVDFEGEPHLLSSVVDITGRKQLEEALAASERKYRDLYDHSPDMYLLSQPAQEIILDCNQTLARTLGYSREELLGRSTGTLYTPACFARLQAERTSFLAEGKSERFDVQLQCKNGMVLDVIMSSTVEPGPASGLPLARVAFHDVTERRQLVERLRASEARLRAVIENTADTVWSVDSSYHFLVGNSVFGRHVQQLIGRPLALGECVIAEPFPQSEREFWKPHYDRALAGESFMVEIPSVLHPGRTLACFMYPIHTADGTIAGVSGRAADITELKQAAQRRQEAYHRLRLAADAAEIGIWNWNFADDSLEWDDRICDFYAVPRAMRTVGIYHQLWRERVHPDDLAANDVSLAAARRDGTEWSSTFRIVWPDGKVRHIYSASVVEQDEQGVPRRMIGINRDVTDQKLYEQLLQDTNAVLEQHVARRTADLETALADLQRANQLKDEFMAMISHELRTPLTGVLSMSEMLEDQLAGPLNDRQIYYVRAIVESGERLLNVLNGILGYTRLLAGRVQLHPEPCDIAYLLDTCAVSQRDKAAVRQQTIAVHVEPPNLIIAGDATAIAEVIKRLLDNAIKFTPKGGQIGLEAHLGTTLDTSDPPANVELVVWDTGVGIAADQFEHVFHAFTQVDASLARTYEGIGIGLAYVDELVRLMGGAIALESTPGAGSRFTITLPTQYRD